MPRLDANIEITESEIKEALRYPSDFGYHGDRPLGETWGFGPTLEHRDSGLLAQSNAAALLKHLESDPSLSNEWEVMQARHWAVGWVDQIIFHAVTRSGQPTRMFRVLMEWSNSLSDYPVADEEDLSRREYEAAIEAITDQGRQFTDEETPENWPEQVWEWLWTHKQEELESRDESGPYPSENAIEAALDDLGITGKARAKAAVGYLREPEIRAILDERDVIYDRDDDLPALRATLREALDEGLVEPSDVPAAGPDPRQLAFKSGASGYRRALAHVRKHPRRLTVSRKRR